MEDVKAVTCEVSCQIDKFCHLIGWYFSHIDSHQHVNLREPVHSVVVEIGRKVGIPLRHCSPTIRYCGNFYGQTDEGSPIPDIISVKGLLKILAELSPGLTELACYQGEGDDLNTMYANERGKELEVLCDPRVRTSIIISKLNLCSFHDAANLLITSLVSDNSIMEKR